MTGIALSEKQVQPLVMYALNREMFKVPLGNWSKEYGIYNGLYDEEHAAAVELIKEQKFRRAPQFKVFLDFVVMVHKGAFGTKSGQGKPGSGFHGIEVKLDSDKDRVRLRRQIESAVRTLDFAWLVRVNADPEYEDERVGLVRYDVAKDRVRVLRPAQRLTKNRVERSMHALGFAREAEKVAKRANEFYKPPTWTKDEIASHALATLFEPAEAEPAASLKAWGLEA